MGSTAISVELGDQRWHSLQARHHAIVRQELKRFHGHEVDTAGDGFFATFGIPADGVRCAAAIAEAMPRIGLQTRAGLHTGETELTGEKVAGIAVTTAARVSALAGPGEVLVTRTVADLVAGAGFEFSDRGEHELKGVPGTWHVLALRGIEGTPFVPSLDPDEAVERRAGSSAAGLEHSRRRSLILVSVVAAIALLAATLPFVLRHTQAPALATNGIQLLDAASGQHEGSVSLRGAPGGIASGGGYVWVSDEQNGTVVKIDPNTRAIVDTITVGNGPSGIAYGDGAVWVALSGDGRLARIEPSTTDPVTKVSVGNGPTGVAVSQGSVWVTNYLDDTVMRVDATTTPYQIKTIGVGNGPVAVAANNDGTWVANYGDGTVTSISAGGQPARPVGVGSGPSGIAITPTAVWVTSSFDNSLWRIDLNTNRYSSTNVGDGPTGVTASTTSVWVADHYGGTVDRVGAATAGVIAPQIQIGGQPVAMTLVGGDVWVAASTLLTAHRGGTLTFASQIAPGSIDPAVADSSLAWQILSLTNDGLMGFARVGGPQGGALVPDLAISVPAPSPDGKTYTFQLRPGIHYSDDTLVKPEDFVRGIERELLILAPKSPPVSYFSEIVGASRCTSASCGDLTKHGIVTTEATATTDATITFQLIRPDPEFLYKLALTFADAVPADTPLKVINAAPFIPATGPYMIRSYTPEVTGPKGVVVTQGAIELGRNPYFAQWSQAAQPDGYPDKIDGSYGLSSAKQVSMIKQGGLDVMADDSPPPGQLSQLKTGYQSQLYDTVLPQTVGFAMNMTRAPFNDRRVRRALNYAVNRNTLVSLAGGPALNQISCQVLPPTFPGYRPYCPYTLHPGEGSGKWSAPDPATAATLVAESHTSKIRITVWTPQHFPGTLWAKYLVHVLRRLGYHTVSRRIVPGTGNGYQGLVKYFNLVTDPQKGASVQICLIGWEPDYFSPSGFITPLFARASIPHGTKKGLNTSHFWYRAIERAMRRALAEQANNPAVAGAAWAGVDRSIVDKAPWVTMPTPKQVYFVSTNTGNVQVSPQWGMLLSQLWVQG